MDTNPDSAVLSIPEIARVGIRLVVRDARFREPIRMVGSLLGQELAVAYPVGEPEPGAAVAAFADACRHVGFVRCTEVSVDSTAGLGVRFDGCEAVLGYRVAATGRAVCSFDEGLLEGFLNRALGNSDITVRETRCLGRGDASCLFVIGR